jgi:hypothetical protein
LADTHFLVAPFASPVVPVGRYNHPQRGTLET